MKPPTFDDEKNGEVFSCPAECLQVNRETRVLTSRLLDMELLQNSISMGDLCFSDELIDGEAQLNAANSNVTWRQGRQLLRQ